jgi:hypothetical protein
MNMAGTAVALTNQVGSLILLFPVTVALTDLNF